MISMPDIKFPPERAFETIANEMRSFQADLPEDMELGINTAGGGAMFYAKQIRLDDPMIIFEGVTEEGRSARLIQHFTQAAVLFVALPARTEQAERMGF